MSFARKLCWTIVATQPCKSINTIVTLARFLSITFLLSRTEQVSIKVRRNGRFSLSTTHQSSLTTHTHRYVCWDLLLVSSVLVVWIVTLIENIVCSTPGMAPRVRDWWEGGKSKFDQLASVATVGVKVWPTQIILFMFSFSFFTIQNSTQQVKH